MRKLLFLLLLFAFLIFGAAYLFDYGAQTYSPKTARLIAEKLHQRGIELSNVSIGHIETFPFEGIVSWQYVTAKINLREENAFLPREEMTLHIDRLTMDLSPLRKKARLSMEGVIVDMPTQKKRLLQNGAASLTIPFSGYSSDDMQQTKHRLQQAAYEFLEHGASDLPINLSGLVTYKINEHWVESKLATQQKGADHHLVMDEESLRIISWILREKLTDAEISFLSQTPIRAPKLLAIRDRALETSESAHAENETIPKDAYRHVLWSYLLTRTYGPEFAKQVTDAHEIGDTDNTEADHRMDYNNNALGREYAQHELREGAILYKVLTDPRVIRTPY